MKQVFLFLLVLTIVGCIGCSSTKTIQVRSAETTMPALELPNPKPLELSDVQFIVITAENQADVLGKNQALFALTEAEYEDLASNLLKIRGFILQQRTIIESYKKYYEQNEDKK